MTLKEKVFRLVADKLPPTLTVAERVERYAMLDLSILVVMRLSRLRISSEFSVSSIQDVLVQLAADGVSCQPFRIQAWAFVSAFLEVNLRLDFARRR